MTPHADLKSPVIVLGAARSGTKLLRDLIGSHAEFHASPFDVNYLWRMGNESVPHDELGPVHATARVIARVRRYLSRLTRTGTTVVEKTVGNTLRVGFVDRIFPDACFVHLLRDGRDVVASAYEQWQAPVDWRHVAAKARQYPFFAAPGYAARWGVARILRSNLPPVWGPVYRGIQDDLRVLPLLQVCARQWQRSVEATFDQLIAVDASRVLTVQYRDLVTDPGSQVARIYEFLGASATHRTHNGPRVSTQYMGSFRTRLTEKEGSSLEAWLGPTLERVSRETGYILSE